MFKQVVQNMKKAIKERKAELEALEAERAEMEALMEALKEKIINSPEFGERFKSLNEASKVDHSEVVRVMKLLKS